ncbi:ABC transporter ATP-binding protein [Kaarinaea lacus]
MNVLLQTKSLTVRIANTLVCKNLDFKVNAGDKWGILGINGIGKTTLLHTLAGLYQASSGEVYYHGKTINELSNRQRAQFRGILFQDKSDPFPATVLESVLIGRHPFIDHWQWESQQDIDTARDNILKMDLQGREQQLVNTLSGGERQRVAIATLLSQQAELLLLDEPTSHLDLKRQMKVMDLFSETVDSENKASVMILHDLNLASRFCNKILMLTGDGNTLQGNCSEMLTSGKLNDLYDYPIEQLKIDGKTVFVPA